MTNNAQLNLARLAAEHAQNVIKSTRNKKASEVDNTVTKALGVLQENGVYACFLYLLARERENGAAVVDVMLSLLDGLGFDRGNLNPKNPDEVLAYISGKVTVELEKVLLAKETLEQMLIYARYGAKARD